MDKKCETIILPCSGIGKAFGTVSRLAALRTVEIDRTAKVVCLGAVEIEGSDANARVRAAEKLITIDGCPKKCAYNIASRTREKNTNLKSVLVWAECKKTGIKPENDVTDVGDSGALLAEKIARLIAKKED